MRRAAHDFCADRYGIAAVEFALLLPILITMYFGMTELWRAIDNSRRVTLFTRAVADLSARVNPDSMDPIFSSAKAILQPFDTSKIEIIVSAIGVSMKSGVPVGRVCSSVASNATPRPVNQITGTDDLPSVPETFKNDGARYILAEARMPYVPVVGTSLFQMIFSSRGLILKRQIPWPERSDTEILLPGGAKCQAF